jgi:hypothetical protein
MCSVLNLRDVTYRCADSRVMGWFTDHPGGVRRRVRAATEPDHLLVILHPDADHNNILRRAGAVVDTSLILWGLSYSEVEGAIGSTAIYDTWVIGLCDN